MAALTLVSGRAVEAALRAVAADARITVFLAPDVTDGAALARTAAEAAGPGAKAEFVTSAAALARLRADLGPSGAALDGLAKNPLPPSIDVRLPPARIARKGLQDLRAAADRLAQLPFAADVDAGQAFVEKLETVLLGVRAGGLGVFAVTLLVALFLVANIVRLAVFARRDEIDILRLVGATDGFIAVPFVLEGAVQGLAGGIVAALLVGAVERFVLPSLLAGFGFGAEIAPSPTGPLVLAAIVVAGFVAGIAASSVAVLRFLRKAV
jgi:cell division transport system permease protein